MALPKNMNVPGLIDYKRLPEWTEPYLSLSKEFMLTRQVNEQFHQKISTLAPPSLEQVEFLAQLASKIGKRSPKEGWTITYISYLAAKNLTNDSIVKAMSAWYSSVMANEWTRPDLAQKTLEAARSGFKDASQSTWLVACDWQLNALPWSRPNFSHAKAELVIALGQIADSELAHFVPECQLALAYAQLLTAEYQAALDTLDDAEKEFKARGSRFYEGRCRLTRASTLRRQGHYPLALKELEMAFSLFQELLVPIEIARTRCQFGYYYLFAENDYSKAHKSFEQALDTFNLHDMPLWQAICWHGRGQVFFEAGRIQAAEKVLTKAKDIYEEFNIPGSLGNVLFDCAKQERLTGNYALSIQYLKDVRKIYEKVHTPLSSAMMNMHLGSTYAEAGQLQLAAAHLEKASVDLRILETPGPLAESQMRLANVYLKLNLPEHAAEQLTNAIQYYDQGQQPAYLSTVYGRLAETAFSLGDENETRLLLEKALTIASDNELRPQIALSRRILGEFLTLIGHLVGGLKQLKRAANEFDEMGIFIERAACQIAIGNCLFKMGEVEPASAAWKEALHVNQGLLDAIVWQSQAGLAQLSAKQGDKTMALEHYREMVSALKRQRYNFWQPVLAGQFLLKPAAHLAQAIAISVQIQSPEDTISFIEVSKAQTIVRQLNNPEKLLTSISKSPEIMAAMIEIKKLNERIEAGYRAGISKWTETARLHQRRKKEIADIGKLYDRLERQQLVDETFELPSSSFNMTHFRDLAQAKLNNSWAALDYYLTDTHLFGAVLTVDGIYVWQEEISDRIENALEICAMARSRDIKPNIAVLTVLGQWLIPARVFEKLTPDTYLLLAPHQILHQVPWPALRCGPDAELLINHCVPVIVHNFHILTLLWERHYPRSLSHQDGLLLAVKEFHGRSTPTLPQVWREVDEIAPKLGSKSQVLVDGDATWPILCRIANQKGGLNRFSFCHIASHASYDPISGRLSSISLSDQDIFVDQLLECAPWPSLVTMAACNGAQSLIYEGDEHMSLVSTLLASGASTVIGSLWPVRDERAADFFIHFYDYFLAGRNPSTALALTQRQASQHDISTDYWSSFLCMGCP